MKKFIFCSKCDGISIKPQISEGKTFCTNCTEGRGGEVDEQVEEFVRELKCRCPPSIRGCDCSGKLNNIEEHMNGCVKEKMKCQKGCGKVLQKCDTLGHQKECPFRNQRCKYCRKEVQANRTKEHARICLGNPDGVVICPYKEVGCETIEIARKDLDTHITKKMISHQKLLLCELNQLREKMDMKEFEISNLDRWNTSRTRSIWVISALVIMGIAILIQLVLIVNQKQIETSKDNKLLEDKLDILRLYLYLQDNWNGRLKVLNRR
ncbi:TNF receptor-associated factor 4 [Oopsacas minuta]|uniref:TNF receptor-associated factor 4 n=1 Tax=Oopsacas minuta TaxID=111878 RepID=A0AAV7K573_9METZ|nr:TNF receptor-associated factor 4 [Oopsacas minuta]KAI6655948.1 TNF receptor-associated factor 4 [Oopsacas minuta]